MNVPDIEAEALKLPRSERARLAEALLESLDEFSQEENDRLWVEVAQRRDRELDEGTQEGRASAEVFSHLRTKLD